MKKVLYISVCCLFCFSLVSAQDLTKDFELSAPELIMQNSLYHSLEFLDSRADSTFMGIVQLGAFNRKARVVCRIPLSRQFELAMYLLTDSTAKNGKLLLQLRQLIFAEITGAMKETGYCYLKAELYTANNNSYQKLASLDTVLQVKSMDVTKEILRNGGNTLINLIFTHLTKTPAAAYEMSLNEIVKIDSIEKTKTPLYQSETLVDGIYHNYNSFKTQLPDIKEMDVEFNKDSTISRIRITNEKGKKEKVDRNEIYAVVTGGKASIATYYGYYPLRKTGDDFFFTGKARVTANTGKVILAGVFFGLLGSLLASNAEAIFEIRIDHTNGGFIQVREIKQAGQ